jgi:hypothetical protein
MVKQFISIAALCLMTACSSTNPFMDNAAGGDTGTGTDSSGTGDGSNTGNTGGISSDGSLPPGTTNPTPSGAIFRSEARVTDDSKGNYGNGFANHIRYDSVNDTFFVDGLAFDSSQPDGVEYNRATPGNLRGYSLYEAPDFHPDAITGTPIKQFMHRAIYGVIPNGHTQFAIVRTGGYINYGFGGFIYQRDNNVVLPTEGQGHYTGDYAGLRDFKGRGGLELVTGDAQVDIDFKGFNNNCTGATCANAIRGYIFNRQIRDAATNADTTNDYVAALNDDLPAGATPATKIPTITFAIGPNVMDSNGEATGGASSTGPDGTKLEAGNYYLLLSGDHTTAPGGEIVGIVVTESTDPRWDNVTVRETGGFIATRK